MLRLLGLFGSIPHKILIKVVVIAAVFAFGYVVGNDHATRAALIEREQAGADTMRENHQQLIGYYAGAMKELRLFRAQQAEADRAAYEIMERGKAAAVKGRRETERRLAAVAGENLKLKGTADELRRVNEVLASEARPDPGCVLSNGVRNALNSYIASINNHPDIGSPQAFPSGVPDGTDPSLEPLTCEQLAASMTDVLEANGMLTAWVLSFQQWVSEALR
jgi:hypothetical protein